MKIFKLETAQVLPISFYEAWAFFSNPHNLSLITPPSLALRIKGSFEGEIQNGMIIEYTVMPFKGIVMDWVSEIKHVQKPYIFVDEQRTGPYKFWYHQHLFKAHPRGVEVIDKIYYALPGGLLAGVLNQCVIKGQLGSIFAHRRRVLEAKFCKKGAND